MASDTQHLMLGRCHCGAITYEAVGTPFAADFCHCRDCQRTTGAPVGGWADFKTEQIRWTRGRPREYASSERIRRGFCARCGSTLTYRSVEHPQFLTVAITSLDSPSDVAPTYHIHTQSQVRWLEIVDDRPRHRGAQQP